MSHSPPLRGVQRAAAVVKGLPAEEAAAVLARLAPAERQALLERMAALALPEHTCRLEARRALTGSADGTPRSPGALAALLQRQHPQIAAVVLARLDGPSVEAVLAQLPPRHRGEVTLRMQSTRPASPAALQIVRAWVAGTREEIV